jgi:hypothetical protein
MERKKRKGGVVVGSKMNGERERIERIVAGCMLQ